MSLIEECKKIYADSFTPDAEFDRTLFDGYSGLCKTLCEDGHVRSMLFSFPCKISYGGQEYNAEYLFAAATDTEHRKKGYMGRLLARVTNDENTIYFLRPANDDLMESYKKSGFLYINGSRINTGICRVIPGEELMTLGKGCPEDGKSYPLMYKSKIPLPDTLCFIQAMGD